MTWAMIFCTMLYSGVCFHKVVLPGYASKADCMAATEELKRNAVPVPPWVVCKSEKAVELYVQSTKVTEA